MRMAQSIQTMKRFLFATFLFIGIGLYVLWGEGSRLTAPTNHAIAPASADLRAEPLVFNKIHGWFIPATKARACVLLVPGLRADRTRMVQRARFLRASGFTTLLIDLQGHGETPGQQLTFGYREAENVKDAVGYLRHTRGCKKVAIIGTSLGGAASLLGPAPAQVDALILEAVYTTVEEAVTNRLATRYWQLAPWLAPLLTQQIPLRLHAPLSALRPIDAIGKIHAPVFVIGGSADQRTKLTETEHLFNRASNPKQLWIVQGAGLVDFHQFAGAGYEQKVLAFLDKYL